MTPLVDGLAEQLAADGFGQWSPDSPYPPGVVGIVVGPLAPDPEHLIGLTTYQGPDTDDLLGYDQPNVQLRVRGDADARTSRLRSHALWERYGGASGWRLPNGLWVVLVTPLQGGPIDAGRNPAGRYEHTVNLSVLHQRATPHRPY